VVSQRDVIRLVSATPVISPLGVRRMSEIEARPVRWIWPGRIARGKITMIAGHPGLGKSQLALALVATVTVGGQWPVGGQLAERGSAMILSAEDDSADTIRPRLEAAGADLTCCHVIEAVHDIGHDHQVRRRGFSLATDLDRLSSELDRIGDVAIVVVDPITAYLWGNVDSHRTGDVRALLEPVQRLAERHGVAVVAISHLRKAPEGDAILRVNGSLAFVAAARAAYIVSRDEQEGGRRLFLPLKNNIGGDRTGYTFAVEPVVLPSGIETCRILWGKDLVIITADEALAQRREATVAPTRRDMATSWLRNLLVSGPVAVCQIEAEAKSAGLAWATVRRAADGLGIVTAKTGYEAGWSWHLPDEVAPGGEIEL
jgi:putative DNA primase/helicase